MSASRDRARSSSERVRLQPRIATSATPAAVSASAAQQRWRAPCARSRTDRRSFSRPPGRAGSRRPAPSAALAAERLVDPQPQLAHVDLDDVGVALEGEVPHVVEDLALRQHLARPPHQELQQRELPRASASTLWRRRAAPGARPGRAQVAGRQHRGRPRPAPAHQRAQPGQQHHVRERLGQEVVGAGVQRLRLVGAPRSWRSASGSVRPVPASRSRAHTSSPSRPGSITSSTTTSYGFSVASHSPSVPSPAMSTAYPSASRPRRSARSSAASSSTTRIRMVHGGTRALKAG